MNGMATPALLPGVDLAAFAAALAARLRDAGIPVSASGQASLVQALQQLVPRTPAALYWGARLTLVSRVDELATFDAVFASLFGVFGSAEPDGANRPPPPIAGPRTPVAGVGHRAKRRSCAAQAQNLPWDTRSLTMASAGQGGPSRTLPDVLPSRTPGPTSHSTSSIPTICVCSAPGWRPRWRAGRGGAACDSSPARTASASTCGRR